MFEWFKIINILNKNAIKWDKLLDELNCFSLLHAISSFYYEVLKWNFLSDTLLGVHQWKLTSLAPSLHWVWVYSNGIHNVKMAPLMSIFIEGLPLFLSGIWYCELSLSM